MHFSDALLSGKGAHIFYFKQRLWLILNNDRFVIGLADKVHRRPWLVSAAGCRLAGDIRAVGIEGPLYDGQKRTVGLPVIYWRFRCRRLRGRCYPGNVQLLASYPNVFSRTRRTLPRTASLLLPDGDIHPAHNCCHPNGASACDGCAGPTSCRVRGSHSGLFPR